MRNKFATFILFLVLVILIAGIVILGGAMYMDLMGDNSNQITYKLDSITTEEPEKATNKVLENDNQNISQSIQGVPNNNTQEQQLSSETRNTISKYFYYQLIDNQKIIYDQLSENKENLKQGNYIIDFGETFSDVLEQENGSEDLGRDYQTAIEAFMHDNPDLFYIDVNKMYLNIETTTRFLKTTYHVYISAAQGGTYLSSEFTSTNQVETAIAEVENVKNSIISNLTGTDYQKILYIHDYLVDHIEYDSSYQEIGSYSIYGALVGRKCVCEGYAKALKYLANAAGIKCEIMQGTATNSSGQTESHAWNCIQVDGIWYEIDSTWDDPIIVGGGSISNKIKYRYFLKGTDTFEKDHVLSYQFSDEGKSFSYPTISKSDY